MQWLLEHKAAVDDFDRKRRTPLLLAAQNGHADVVCLLAHAKADVDKCSGIKDTTAAIAAAQAGYEDVALALVRARADVNKARSYALVTPAFVAAQQGHAGVIKVLVEARADMRIGSATFGHLPTYAAAHNGHAGVRRLLLQGQADADDSRGNHPMLRYYPNHSPELLTFVAAMNGRVGVLRVLIEAKTGCRHGDVLGRPDGHMRRVRTRYTCSSRSRRMWKRPRLTTVERPCVAQRRTGVPTRYVCCSR